ncbi:MAG: RDD family protein [Acidimicrobiales bacterium]
MSNFDPNAPGGPPPGWTPPPGGQPPPYGAPQFGAPAYGAPQGNYMAPPNIPGPLAEWPQRAIGWLIDFVFFLVPWIVLWVLTIAAGTILFELLGDLYSLALGIFLAYQLGVSGSTPGMRIAGLKCVKADGQVLGGGMGVVRAICHWVASILCFIPFVVDMLFPLWDSQKQTLADKVMKSYVIVVPKQGFSITPPSS